MISYMKPRNRFLLSTSVSLTDRSQPSESQLIHNQKNDNHSFEKDIEAPVTITSKQISLKSTKSIPEKTEDISNSLVTESPFSMREVGTDTSCYADTCLVDKLEEQGLSIDANMEISKRKMQCAKIDEPLVKHGLNTEITLPNTDSQGKLDKNIKRLSLPSLKTRSNIFNSITTITRKIAPQAAVRFSERMLKLNTKDNIIVNQEFDSTIHGTLAHDFTAAEQPGGNYGFPKIGSQDEMSLSSISLDSMVSGISLETTGSERNLTPISLERSKEDVYITLDASSRQNSISNRLIISTSKNLHAETKSPELCLNLYYRTKDESFDKAGFKTDVKNTACDDKSLIQLITASVPPSKFHKDPDAAAEKEMWELITDQNSSSKKSKPSSNASNLESEKRSSLNLDLKEMAHKDFESEGTVRKTAAQNTHDKVTLNQLAEDSRTGYDGIKKQKDFKVPEPQICLKGSECNEFDENKQVSKLDSAMISADNLHTRGFQSREVQILGLDTENFESTKILNAPQGTDTNYPSDTRLQSLNNGEPCVILPMLSITSPEIIQNSTLLDDFYFDEANIATLQNYSSSSAFDANIFDKQNRLNCNPSTETIPSLSEVSPCTRVSNPFIPSSCSFAHVPKAEDHELDLQLSSISSNQPANDLTEESLEAYQCALASAAFTAAANDKFCRDFNISNYAAPLNEEPNQSGLKTQLSEDIEESCLNDYEDDFDFEDKYQDCAIIAEANAEVLAFDFDGFYGQEFGFYSAANSSDNESVSENGGVFGPIGLERKRSSQSGRFGSHERNLTPITERSEYSNQNSSMSPCIQSPSSVRDIISWNSPSSRYDSER
ncbi:hypothetical protein GcC1_150004 [Golovinomyces cichoracearum]|uniref:Uncharacterized protein n=1 Tax=Golovinomyces cichoracearum TaxID=62708 RepID=A0A420HXB6_9PEZI|nr:hypothetical protein GcC1_150004 [Golovinomyces cichoracearum]